jgi:lycopene beta-cyclase
MQQRFNYIITGGGAAGLSLGVRMLQAGLLNTNTLAIIEKYDKIANDRTWCFWEKSDDLFESIVYQRWHNLHFFSNHYSSYLNLQPYQYKMIRGADFYSHCKQLLHQSPNVHFIKDEVKSISNTFEGVSVQCANNAYTAPFCFNSLLFEQPKISKSEFYFLQHFKGWMVETPTNFFTEAHATLMDFRVSQQHGTTFVYVLPVNPRNALIEYTLFTEKLLNNGAYDSALKQYIKQYLQLNNYRIIEEEFGVIPMTNYRFPVMEGNILNIGTAGGWTKASSGYTFKFIQRKTASIVAALLLQENLPSSIKQLKTNIRFHFYDTVLLHVLKHGKTRGDKIFSRFFKYNTAAAVFSFLDNDTTLLQDFSIITKMPVFPFTKAALKEILR